MSTKGYEIDVICDVKDIFCDKLAENNHQTLRSTEAFSLFWLFIDPVSSRSRHLFLADKQYMSFNNNNSNNELVNIGEHSSAKEPHISESWMEARRGK